MPPIDFFTWYRDTQADLRASWLVLGKGPTFANRNQQPIGDYKTLGLNHVLREQPVLLAHAIDIEVIEHCQDVLEANARYLVMPWIPHERKHLPMGGHLARFGPSDFDLRQWCERLPALAALARQDRLLYYNLHTAPPARRQGTSPVVTAHGFSSTSAIRLLAMAGARRIRTLGVDGGNRYAAEFSDLSEITRLQSWQTSYDMQFEDIAQSIMAYELDCAPLDVQSPVRIFVGMQPEQQLAFEVLRYSIRRHASLSVDVIPLFRAVAASGITIPAPQARQNRPRTPFTFQRFAIPKLRNYQGRAIYLDSDMLVFRDIRELWMWPLQGAQVLSVREPPGSGRRPQFSVMVMDCEALKWDVAEIINRLDHNELTYEQAVHEMKVADRVAAVLPEDWNELERYREGRTALLHYTDMSRQPWLTADNPNARYWCEELLAAIEAGQISRDQVENEVRTENIRPSLLYQIDCRIADPLLLPSHILYRDATTFIPPHVVPQKLQSIRKYGPSRWLLRQALWGYALAREIWRSKRMRALVRQMKKLMRNLQ